MILSWQKLSEEDVKSRLPIVPDFPHRGIQFVDIMPVFADHDLMMYAIQKMNDRYLSQKDYADKWREGVSPSEAAELEKLTIIDKVVAIESRGFLFGAQIAYELGVPLVPVRKPGKLPGAILSRSYNLEYGHGQLQMQAGAIKQSEQVLIVDDILATGGTLECAAKMIEECNAYVAGISVFYEIESLAGRNRLVGQRTKYNVHSVIKG